MFSCFKKSENKIVTTRGLFIGAMSHVKLIAETRVYICHKNTKSVDIFSQFFECFRWKIYKENILQEMKNGLSLRQQQLQVIILHNHLSISIAHLHTKLMDPQKMNNTFIFL